MKMSLNQTLQMEALQRTLLEGSVAQQQTGGTTSPQTADNEFEFNRLAEKYSAWKQAQLIETYNNGDEGHRQLPPPEIRQFLEVVSGASNKNNNPTPEQSELSFFSLSILIYFIFQIIE